MDEAVRTVADAMLITPVQHGLETTVSEIRSFFDDGHVHAALIVGPADYLSAVVERDDIASQDPGAAAAPLGRLADRTVLENAGLRAVQRSMIATGRRRAAVITADGKLAGLLCLKASQTGFCSEDDVRSRALAGHGDR